MGILQLYPTKEFYTSVSYDEFRPGQFCWLPVPHIDPVPRILDVERSAPEEHNEVKFFLRNANRTGDFTKRDRVLPVKNLNLRSHEELLVQRAKKRPGIILSSNVDVFSDIAHLLKQMGKKHLQEEVIFVIPCYTIQTEENISGFPPEMVARIKCLMYRQFFFFPDCTPHHLLEGIARFDRIQTIVGRDSSAIKPTEVALSEEVFNLFLAMFIYCITGEVDQDLETIKSLIREAYSEE